jgi:hypothetical protein
MTRLLLAQVERVCELPLASRKLDSTLRVYRSSSQREVTLSPLKVASMPH